MLILYTDGASKRNGKPDARAAWAWALVKDDELVTSNAQSIGAGTNNQAELMAIISGLNFIKENYPDAEVTVYADSKYCLDGITSWVDNWVKYGWYRNAKQTQEVKNLEMWKELKSLRDEIKPTWKWTKGHSDSRTIQSYFNNLVDGLAQGACE